MNKNVPEDAGGNKHTLGPWRPNAFSGSLVYAADGTLVADVKLARDLALVSAAPQMLEELRHLVRALEPLEANGGFSVGSGLATLNGARAAIAAAEGRS